MVPAERPAGDLGRKLREARERLGVSLREIADRTKIAVSVLEGLERNDISRLPGGIFGRAFVRSFASEIGLDPEATIQEFILQFPQDSVSVGHPRSKHLVDNEALESDRRVASTVLRLFAMAVPTAAVVVYLGIPGRVTEPTAADRSTAASTAQAAAAETADARPAAANAPGTIRPGPDAASGERVVVALSVTRRCRLSAVVDGEKQAELLLQPGDQRTFQVSREMLLTVDDAGAVAIAVNGVAVRPLGKDGEVVTKRFTPGNLAEFLPAR